MAVASLHSDGTTNYHYMALCVWEEDFGLGVLLYKYDSVELGFALCVRSSAIESLCKSEKAPYVPALGIRIR
jgi:hypothetical protein